VYIDYIPHPQHTRHITIAITEALPFIVCTVSFDKTLHLTCAVFSHLQITTPLEV
jgi:hypothetical protein